MGIKYLVPFIVGLFSSIIDARPVSYPGGITVMGFSDNMKDSIYVHYSPTHYYSLGLETKKDKYSDSDYSYLRFTYLLDRKNTQHSQRNFYFQSGVSPDKASNHFIGFHGDWETRRLYAGFSYKNAKVSSQSYSDQFIQLGIAPYLGEYGDIHTWIMMKAKKNTLDNDWSVYPMLKLFKGDFLLEVGYNNKTKLDAHLMYRF